MGINRCPEADSSGRYALRAEIDYRAGAGKKIHRAFEGTRAEIRKDIQAENDLPGHERTHLLRILDLHDPVFEFHFPRFESLGPRWRAEPWDEP